MLAYSIYEFLLLIFICLGMALIGLYLLTIFDKLFTQSIRPKLLRKNVAAFVVIFCITAAFLPMSSTFFYIMEKHGFWWMLAWQTGTSVLLTLIVYNLARFVAENRRFKKLPFIWHQALIILTIIIAGLSINMPFTYILYPHQANVMKLTAISSIYLAGATGLVYAMNRYLAKERKRKFDAKELELSRMRELKSKAELEALQSKVNPHFLYNALNSIADLSITDGKKGRKMTIALADLFRYSINYSNSNFATVQEEVEMTEVYLQIEKIRFEDRLNYFLDIDTTLRHYLIPRFLLQPLVENAVKHGLKATGQLTKIDILLRPIEKGMVFEIKDNGPDFPESITPGYGVKSVFDKLDLLFPEQYEIHFSNTPEKKISVFIFKMIKDETTV